MGGFQGLLKTTFGSKGLLNKSKTPNHQALRPKILKVNNTKPPVHETSNEIMHIYIAQLLEVSVCDSCVSHKYGEVGDCATFIQVANCVNIPKSTPQGASPFGSKNTIFSIKQIWKPPKG